jgi:tRNA/tmRNA/rRNA uracil-C5-methylase (TrmA/RlmC/RlmD family)
VSDLGPEALTLRIEKAVAGGRMLARADGAVVLVAGALPGELVIARVERRGRGALFARTERLLEASADRVGEPNPCGGCVLAHARYELQMSIKQQIVQDAFARLGRHAIDAPAIVPSPTEGYRMRARLHVQDRRVGFYLEGTHTLCDAASTRQLRPDTTDAIEALMRALGATADGVLALELAENREATERAVHLEVRADTDTARLGSLEPPGITSLSVSHADSPRIRVVRGDGRITDRFARAGHEWAVTRSTSAFFQGNRYLIEALVGHVVERLGHRGLTDLYAGVGLFSIAAAAQGLAPVMAVEGDALSAADLRRNSAPWRGLIQARHASVEEYLRDRRVLRSPTLLLDPPRTGLSRRALAGVIALRSPRVVYVSCDVPTLARDARAFIDAGYRMGELTLFDLFPNTAHVESVGVFDRDN